MDANDKARLISFLKGELARGHEGVDVERDSLVDSGIIDSLGIMKLVQFLAKELKVQIGDDELVPDNFDTLAAIVQLIDDKRRG